MGKDIAGESLKSLFEGTSIMQYHRIRLLLLLLLILPVTAIIFFSEGCEKKESTDPKPFKTEPVEEKKSR